MKRLLLTFCLCASLWAATPSLKMKTYDVLSEAQQLMEKKKYDEAKKTLDDYAPDIADVAYDSAYLQNIYGYLFLSTDNYESALKAFEKAYTPGVLPETMQQNLRYNLAQLYMATERYDACVVKLKTWMAHAKQIKPEHYMMLAQALTQAKRYQEAIDPVRKAIALSEKPAESHYQLLFYLYFEEGLTQKAIETIQAMIRLFPPQKRYWMQLSGLYAQTKDYRRSLATLRTAYLQGYLTSSSELLQLAALYRAEGLPYDAARITERALREEKIPANQKIYKLLGDTWMQAREHDKAIGAYTQAAAHAKDGEIYLEIAKLYADVQQWRDAADAAQKALDKGVKARGETWFLKGLALYETERILEAKRAFAEAAKDPKTRKRARQWIHYIASD